MSLLLVERIVIESLIRGQKNLIELAEDTGLKESMLVNILNLLKMKRFINVEKQKFSLDGEYVLKFFKEYKHSSGFQLEVLEVLNSFAKSHFDKKTEGLAIKKVWLSKDQERILNSFFYNAESFIQNLEKEQSRSDAPLVEKKVIFWGKSGYSDLLKSSLERVC